MKEKVYITGHRNPDTDSICSALAYAELKNKRDNVEAVPIRIGELNQETRFVLEYFDVQPPVYMPSLTMQVKDLDYDRPFCVSPEISLNKATSLIQENNLNSLYIVDEYGELIGITSLSNITKSYIDIWDDGLLDRANTPIDNILEVLNASLIHLPENPRPYSGIINVYAMETSDAPIQENDIIMVGNRKKAQKDCIEKGVSLLILTNGSDLEEGLLEEAKENRITIIKTEFNNFMTSRLLPQAVPVSCMMTKKDLIYFRMDEYLNDVRPVMARTKYRTFPVLDLQDHVIGSLSRSHLMTDEKKKLILVDHNERTQSISDIEEAEIVEIIDHHRVANITTANPIYFRNMPVGCTCTIIAQMFFEQGVRPSAKTAGLMCAAIISDTLLFRSPTCTEHDKLAVRRLARIANLDVERFAMEMFEAGTNLENKKPSEILKADVKFYNIEGVKIKISQVFTMNLDTLGPIKKRLVVRMGELLKEQNEDTYILLMTDIFQKKSEVMIAGDYGDVIAQEFGQELVNDGFVAEGVVSRKKQIIPRITSAIARMNASTR